MAEKIDIEQVTLEAAAAESVDGVPLVSLHIHLNDNCVEANIDLPTARQFALAILKMIDAADTRH